MNIKTILSPSPGRYDLALAIIRIVVGFTFLMHGWQKMFMMGLEGVGGFFGSLGIPAAGFMAIVVTLLELLGGLALMLGLGTRIVGALLAADMLVAMFTVHISNGFFVSNGGVELVLLLLAVCLSFVIAGAGSLSVDSRLSG